MRPTIGRWHTRYRVAGEGGAGVARLENGVRERVAESYAAALDQLFGSDPAVYVLRRVETELTVVNPSMADEPAIARRWAERTCAAVVGTVTRHGDDAARVMRFDDTAAFVAQWIEDLLEGVAWDRWYYTPFAMYRDMPVEDAIRAALLEYREHLAAILRRLRTRGRLTALLARVSPETARELWRDAVRGDEPPPSDEQFRVFVRAAFGIAGALQLWAAERPDEGETTAAYVATAPPPPDWKRPRALAEAVFAALAFLERRRLVAIDRRAAVDGARVRESVAALEWLDAEWLAAAVEAWLIAEPEVTSAARPRARTALQQRMVDALKQFIATRAVTLPDGQAASERNALALFAALAAAEPQLARHAAAPAAIESVLQSLAAAAAAPAEAARRTALSEEGDAAVETAHAGVFLLSRAILEARIPQLAGAFGLPLPSLLRALAVEWQADPLDAGIAFWSGCPPEPEPLDPARCAMLHGEVVRLMRDRAAFAPSLAPDESECRDDIRCIAWHLLRLWAHWLPGVAQSSVPWLLQQLVVRGGVLRPAEKTVAVSLAPAPLDVVLEMAGYLAPIAAVPWLDDRRVTFCIDRSLR